MNIATVSIYKICETIIYIALYYANYTIRFFDGPIKDLKNNFYNNIKNNIFKN